MADPHADQLTVLRRPHRGPQLGRCAPVQPVRRRDRRPRRQAASHHLHAAGIHARGIHRCDTRADARRRRLAGAAARDDSWHRQRVRHSDAPVVHRRDGGQGRPDECDRAELLAVQRRARTLMVLTAILSVFGFPYIAMMPVFARDVLHRGAAGYGALTSSIGIGAVIGALGVAFRSGRIRRRGRLMLVGGTAFGLLLMAFSASRALALSMVLLALTGCAMIVNNSIGNTLLQTSAPDHLRGRIMGFYSFVFVGMAPFGAFLFGLVAEHVGVPATLAAGGAIVALAVTIAGWAVPELRGI